MRRGPKTPGIRCWRCGRVNRTAYLILGADKGLAGAYTSNVLREVLPQVAGKDNVHLLTVGRKVRDYFRRRGYTIDQQYTGFSEKPSYDRAVAMARDVASAYARGEYDEVYLVYTRFFSPVNHRPTTIKLLPVDTTAAQGEDEPREYIFEPSAEEVLGLLLPKYLETVVYGALLQSAASELGARMTAMGSATENAEELISKLVLNYNKVPPGRTSPARFPRSWAAPRPSNSKTPLPATTGGPRSAGGRRGNEQEGKQ